MADPTPPTDDAADATAETARAAGAGPARARADRGESDATADTALAGAPPIAAPLDLAMARAKTAAALFGDAEPVKIGRYRVIERAGSGGMGVVWSAWDPELGRGVALKLASSGDTAARARARDEGRALARLSHPNVVPIYDVLEHPDGVFLVMELVKGETLRHAARTQTAAQIVRAYRQAGEGLAAAHRAGLIHRDFKPDNAILGADGRVRVLDFGLAHEVAPDGAAEATAIAGTPRYMAPEQRTGAPLTAAVDQYALCVALRETLASAGAVPRWLQPIVARGTADQPGDRFGSMDELLRALALDPATRWRRRALIAGGVGAAAAVAAAFTIGRARPAESPCEGGPALIAPSWGAGPRGLVAWHLATLTTPYAAEAAPRILSQLDAYAGRWIDLHRGACQAHRRGEISADLLDRRAGCLGRRKAALATVAGLAATTTAPALPDLIVALGGLPDLDSCDDDAGLLAAVPPPPPALAIEASVISDRLARVDVERDAGRIDDATADAEVALARAVALGYRPLLARAHLARGRIALATSRGDRGAADFALATREGLAAGDLPLAIEAYARQAFAVATMAGPERATEGLPLVQALVEQAGSRAGFARALLDHNLGVVALARGDRKQARVDFSRARSEAADVDGAGAVELTVVLASLLVAEDDPAVRAQIGAELIARRTTLVGPHHPLTLQARITAAELEDDPAQVRAHLTPPCREIATYHPSQGPFIGECGHELTWLATAAGDLAAARAAAALVIAAAPAGADPDHVALARAYDALALGHVTAAIAAFTAVLRPLADDAPWWAINGSADVLLGRAMARLRGGDRAGGLADLDEAAALYARITSELPPPARLRRQAAIESLRR